MNGRVRLLLLVLAVMLGVLAWVVRRDERRAPSSGAGRTTSAEGRPELAPEWRELPDDVKPVLADSLRERTGIVLRVAIASFTAPGGKITGSAPPRDEARSAALTVVGELQRYPDAYLRAAAVDTIILVRDIRAGGRTWGGIASPPNRALMMTTESSSAFWRHTLHHELFHLFDRGLFDDAAWGKLNPSGFQYRPDQALIVDPGVGFGIDRTLYGFVSRYAMFSAREDRAELFAWLVTDHSAVAAVAAKDRVLTAKIQQLTGDVFARVPEMDDAFWGAR